MSTALDPTAGWSFGAPPLRPGEVEFCGVGRAAAESPAAKALEQQANDQTAAAAERLFAVVDGSSDPLTRAAAMLARDERDAQAEAARRTSDATIYAMAMRACGRAGTQPRSPSCAALGASQMARLDADNVVPWLAVSVEAAQRNDSHAVAEAVHRASLAKESRSREFLFTDLALSALPADWPPRDAMLASAKVLEIHAALMLPSYLAVFQYCAKERMPDANAQQTCDRLARVLIERGDTLIDYGLGRRLGERAGWPAELVELHNARREAYKRAGRR